MARWLCLAVLVACTYATTQLKAAVRVPTPAAWHRSRREAILAAHPEVADFVGRERWTLPALAAVNVAQVGACVACAHLPDFELVPAAIFLGGTLSLWQFALLHDIKHGTAELPRGVNPDQVLFAGSLPALFGYYLYLRYGHLTHHKSFGSKPIRDLFDSEQAAFEDGDALFVAHRQSMTGDAPHERVGFAGTEDVGGLGLSISRTIYSWLWLDGAGASSSEAARRLVPAWNAAVFAFSMTFERAALVFGGAVVPAVVGRNFFFPNKPEPFHTTCTSYARASLLLALGVWAAAGPGALAWLFWAEVGWQLPFHPASAMFVSNHPSLDAADGASADAASTAGVNGCQPTASIYLGDAYDWLCCFSNYHTEHHDFPDVPAFRLRALRDAAPEFYSDDCLKGARDGWWETMRRTFAQREFYACSGALDAVSDGLPAEAR